MRYQGKISVWNDEKGFGFVIRNGDGEKAFVHIKAFTGRRRPSIGDSITYELTHDKQGRVRADHVRFASAVERSAVAPATSREWDRSSIFATVFCVLLIVVTAIGRLHYGVLVLYSVVSLTAYVAYALDKSAAQNNSWRTQESTLHFFGVIGGWPGALLAQKRYRHKSSKKEFQDVYWTTVVINSIVFAWFLTDKGSTLINSIFAKLLP